MTKYVLQVKLKDWEDTVSEWYPGNYDEYLFYEMLRSNLDFARKVSDKEFRIVKRTIEETVVY